MLKFVPDYFKTKSICKDAIKKLPFIIRYVPDPCNIKKMCDKAIPENGGMLKKIYKSMYQSC